MCGYYLEVYSVVREAAVLLDVFAQHTEFAFAVGGFGGVVEGVALARLSQRTHERVEIHAGAKDGLPVVVPVPGVLHQAGGNRSCTSSQGDDDNTTRA